MKLELTYEKTVEVLKEVVAEVGRDHVARSCTIFEYQDKVKVPACIVGYALHHLVGAEAFQAVENGEVEDPLNSLDISATRAAYALLDVVQLYQDGRLWSFPGRRPWGDAVDYAINKVGDEYATV